METSWYLKQIVSLLNNARVPDHASAPHVCVILSFHNLNIYSTIKKNKQATLLWAVLVTGGPCLLSTAVSSVLPLESQHIFQVREHKFRVKITLHQRGWELFLSERNSSVFWVVKSRKISRTFILSHVACAQCPWANHHDTGRAKLNKCMRQTAINTAEYHHYAF